MEKGNEWEREGQRSGGRLKSKSVESELNAICGLKNGAKEANEFYAQPWWDFWPVPVSAFPQQTLESFHILVSNILGTRK